MEGADAVIVRPSGAHSAVLDWTNLLSIDERHADTAGKALGSSAASSVDKPDEDDRDSSAGTKDTYEAFLDLAYTRSQDEAQDDQQEEDNEPDLDAVEEIDVTQVFHLSPSQTCLVQRQEGRRGWVTIYNGSGTSCAVSQLSGDQENLFRIKIFKNGHSSTSWIPVSVSASGNVQSGRELLEVAKRGNASDVTEIIVRLQKTSQTDRMDACAEEGVTPCVACALRGAKESLAMLLEGGAGPQVVTGGVQMNPMQGAAWGGFGSLIRRIESAGASWEDSDRSGFCGLEYAIWGCQQEVVNMAVQSGDTLQSRSSGEPILSVAIKSLAHQRSKTKMKNRNISFRSESSESQVFQMEAILQYLIANGASVNERGSGGNTPLHTAIILDENEAAELLLKHGADLTVQNNLGHTPLYIAQLRAPTITESTS